MPFACAEFTGSTFVCVNRLIECVVVARVVDAIYRRFSICRWVRLGVELDSMMDTYLSPKVQVSFWVFGARSCSC